MRAMADAPPCFHEENPELALSRRALAEFTGTLMLVFAASGAGHSATRLFPHQPGAAALMITVAVPASLVGLIVTFGRISGGHFNPLISGLQGLAGQRSAVCALVYIAAQIIGGVGGGILASIAWGEAAQGAGAIVPGAFASEFIASAGLMLVVFGVAWRASADTGPFAVGAWLLAAILATPTGSYANPAVTIGAAATSGPLALGETATLLYVGAELAGALAAFLLIAVLFPKPAVHRPTGPGA